MQHLPFGRFVIRTVYPGCDSNSMASGVGHMTSLSRLGACKSVFLVILNPGIRQILLVRHCTASGTTWTVPKVPMRGDVSCRRAAVRYLRRRLQLPALHLAPVIGRLFAIDDAEKRGVRRARPAGER